MEGLGIGIIMINIAVMIIIGVIANRIDKQDKEQLRQQEQRRQRSLAFSLSLIYIFNDKDLSVPFNTDDFVHYTAMFRLISFASISELQAEGFIKIVTLAYRNYDNNGIYKYTTPAQYQITESGITFLKDNYNGSFFEHKLHQLDQQPTLQQMSAEELRIEAAKKEATEKQEMQKRIKQLETKLEDTEQKQQDLQNRHNMLVWWEINNHYNRHK